LVDAPIALTDAFGSNSNKVTQWNAFLRRNRLDVGEMRLDQVVAQIAEFLESPRLAVVNGSPFEARWPAGGPWLAG